MAIGADQRVRTITAFVHRVFLFLLNIFLGLWFLFWTAVITVASLPVNFCRYRWAKRGGYHLAVRRFVQFYGRSIIRLFWPVIRVRIENAAEVRQIEPCIYVLNHFSFVDVFFCGFLPGHQTVVAIRSWPFKIPIFNFFMRWAEYRDVEASTPEEILTWAKAMLESGICLLFFPEGHRARAGRMLPLHKGAFRIAAENNVPIVPVTIQGTEYLGGGKSRLLTPCRVKMRFHPPVEAEGRSPATIIKLLHHVEALYKREVYGQPVWTQPSASKET